MSFDITDIVLAMDSLYNRKLPGATYLDLLNWLKQNVGDIIPFEDKDRKWLEDGIVDEGHGWRVECVTETDKDDEDEVAIVGWYLTIDDPELETLYALKWVR